MGSEEYELKHKERYKEEQSEIILPLVGELKYRMRKAKALLNEKEPDKLKLCIYRLERIVQLETELQDTSFFLTFFNTKEGPSISEVFEVVRELIEKRNKLTERLEKLEG